MHIGKESHAGGRDVVAHGLPLGGEEPARLPLELPEPLDVGEEIRQEDAVHVAALLLQQRDERRGRPASAGAELDDPLLPRGLEPRPQMTDEVPVEGLGEVPAEG